MSKNVVRAVLIRSDEEFKTMLDTYSKNGITTLNIDKKYKFPCWIVCQNIAGVVKAVLLMQESYFKEYISKRESDVEYKRSRKIKDVWFNHIGEVLYYKTRKIDANNKIIEYGTSIVKSVEKSCLDGNVWFTLSDSSEILSDKDVYKFVAYG